jgi:hypothetical protein
LYTGVTMLTSGAEVGVIVGCILSLLEAVTIGMKIDL